MNPIQGKRILLGVTGSVAVYKAVDLASKLTQAGAEVDVLLTEAAIRFVSPLSFQSVTGRTAHTDAELWGAEAHVLHVNLGRPADLLLVAPITANTIAKFAHGLADNLLSLTALSARCPLMIAPAMDGGMFASVPNQENLQKLISRGAIVVGPEEGHLASGLSAKGRMTEPAEILNRVRHLLSRGGRLRGRKVIVTAGGTQEPLDPVRMLTNRSSGKQGFAIAQAALDEGAEVTLIAGPVALAFPYGAKRIDVHTAEEMRAAVLSEAAGCRRAHHGRRRRGFPPRRPGPAQNEKERRPRFDPPGTHVGYSDRRFRSESKIGAPARDDRVLGRDGGSGNQRAQEIESERPGFDRGQRGRPGRFRF